MNRARRLPVVAAWLAAAATVGCGSGSDGPPAIGLSVTSPAPGAVIKAHSAIFSGSAMPNSQIEVNGVKTAALGSGHWAVTVPLNLGDNPVEISASHSGLSADSAIVSITRSRTPAEHAEFMANAPKRRKAARLRERAVAKVEARRRQAEAAKHARYEQQVKAKTQARAAYRAAHPVLRCVEPGSQQTASIAVHLKNSEYNIPTRTARRVTGSDGTVYIAAQLWGGDGPIGENVAVVSFTSGNDGQMKAVPVTGSELLDLPTDDYGIAAPAEHKALDCVNAIVMREQGKTP